MLAEAFEPSPVRPVAAFDFDRTLTTADSLRIFYLHAAGRKRFARALLATSPRLIVAVARGGQKRDIARAALTRYLLSGLLDSDATATAEHVGELVEANLLRADVLTRLRWHRNQGHRVIVVSASFAPYVERAVAAEGVECVLATRWEVGPDGRLTGELDEGNVRGERKAELLREHLGYGDIEYAYGDSAGDREMLAMSRNPVWISPRPITEVPCGAGPQRRAGSEHR